MKGSRPSRIPTALTCCNLISLVFLYIAENLVGERHWLTTLLLYCPQYVVCVPCAVLLFWSFVTRRWSELTANAVAMMLYIVVFLGWNEPVAFRPHVAGPAIRLMTYNIHHAAGGVDNIAKVIRRAQPDVICLQEANGGDGRPDPIPELRVRLKHWDMRRTGDLATLTQGSILSVKVHRISNSIDRVFLETRVRLKQRELTVLNVHLATGSGQYTLTHRTISLPAYVHETVSTRSQQVSALLRVSNSIASPVILVGDFNNPPRGRLYRRLTNTFSDAFHASGHGFGYTFRSDLPVMRIDYILLRQGLLAEGCRVLNVSASDHRPVIADFALRS